MPDPQYSDVPQGAQVVHDPSAYSDLPPGATVVHDSGPQQPGFFKRLGQSLGVPTSKAELEQMAAKEQSLPWYKQLIPHMPGQEPGIADVLAGPGAAQAGRMIGNYAQTAGRGIKEGLSQAKQAGEQYGRGEISFGQGLGKATDAGLHAALQATPIIGPSIETAGQDIAAGNYRGAAGGLTGVIGQIAAPEIIKRAPAATAGARTAIADALEQSSAKNLADVLRPTTKANKFIAQNKVIPGMQERGVVAATGKGLAEKAGTMKEAAGQAIDDAFDALPNQPSIPAKPIIDKLEAMKADFINESPQPGGTVKKVVLDPGAIDRINQVQDLISEHGDSLSPQAIRKLRQFFDTNVAKGQGYAGKTLAEGQTLDVQREAANAIRGELAKSVPGLSDLNGEFSFWKNLEDVMNATNQRRVGQVGGGLGRKIATGVGASVGGSVGGVKGAIVGAEAGNFLSRAVNSTAWNTVSSKLKMALADALATKDPVQVNATLHDIQQAVPALKTSAMPAQAGIKAEYPMAGKSTDGLSIGTKVKNTDSISASLGEEYRVLKGIREVPLSDFESSPRDLFYAADDLKRVRSLAEQIKQSGRIDPLIVVTGNGADFPYILEGGHRLGALNMIGKKSFPAMVVEDTSSQAGSIEQGGHAGNAVSSVEELNRPGTNYVVSKGGQITYHGKSFAPESTPSGATHVTVLPGGKIRVNAGTLSPAQNFALKKAINEQ